MKSIVFKSITCFTVCLTPFLLILGCANQQIHPTPSKNGVNLRLSDPRLPGKPEWFSSSNCESPWPLPNQVKSIDSIATNKYSKYICAYIFDDIGRLIELTSSGSSGSREKIRFNYHGNAEQPYSSECDEGFSCNSSQFEYDQYGNLTKETALNHNGSENWNLKYNYGLINFPNRIIVTAYENKHDGRGDQAFKQEFFEPLSGRLIGALYKIGAFSIENGHATKASSGIEIKYLEHKGNVLVKTDDIDPDDPANKSLIKSTNQLVFNKKGLILSEKYTSYIQPSYTSEKTYSYETDNHGNWITRVMEDQKVTRRISY